MEKERLVVVAVIAPLDEAPALVHVFLRESLHLVSLSFGPLQVDLKQCRELNEIGIELRK